MKTILLAVGSAAMGLAWTMQAGAADDLGDALRKTKPLMDLRLRVENVDQDGIAEDAHATTLRARLGFETGKYANTALLVEGEGLLPIQTTYRADPSILSDTNYPVVADAKNHEINRFQLTNASLPGTILTLGRQRILLDDQRFVGNSGWRQNEQTFDALRVVNRSVKNLVLDFTYLKRVNRVNGVYSPQRAYEGDSFLLNAGYQFKVGKLSAFSYLLDFEPIPTIPANLNPVRDATSTYGVRFAGETPIGQAKIGYAASYAQQKDYADNPLNFDLDYQFVELNLTVKQFAFGVGREVLEGDGVKGFSTPLASLHKWQGWADKFTATPADGIQDQYATAGVTFKNVGGLETLGFVTAWHEYEADRISLDYGNELNIQLTAKIKKLNLMLKFADYDQGLLTTVRSTQKVWGQVEYVW